MDSPPPRNKHLDFQLQREREKVRQLEETLRAKQELIARLEQEKAELRRAKAFVDDENKKAKSERERIHTFQKEISEKSSQITELHKRCDAFRSERDLIRAEATQSIDQWKDAEQRWVLDISSLKSQLADALKSVDRRLAAEEALKREIDELSRQLDTERSHSTRQEKKLAELQSRNQESWDKVEELVQGSFTSQELVVQLRGEIEHMKALLREREGDVGTAAEATRIQLQRVEALQASAAADAQRIESLRAKIRELESIISDHQDSDAESRRRAVAQQKEIDLLKRESENHHKVVQQMEALLEEKDSLTKAVTQQASRRIEMTLTAECDDLKAQLTNERKGHTLTTIALQKAKTDVAENAAQQVILQETLEKSQLELEKLADKLARSLESLELKQSECNELRKEVLSVAATKDDEIRFLEEDISKRKKTISEQQTQLDDLNNILTRIHEDSMDEKKDLQFLRGIKAELETLKPLLQSTQQELASAMAHGESIEALQQQTMLQLQSTQETLRLKEQQLTETQHRLEFSVSECDSVRATVDSLKEQLADVLHNNKVQIDEMREMLLSSQAELSEAQVVANNARRSFGGKVAALELENRSMEEEIRAKNERIVQCENEVNSMAEQLTARDKLLEEATAKLFTQKKGYSDRAQAAEEVHLAVKSELVESQSTVRKLRTTLEEKDIEISENKALLEINNKKLASLEKRKQEYKDAFETTKDRLIRSDELRSTERDKAVTTVTNQNKEILYWRDAFEKLKVWCETKDKENADSKSERLGKRARTESQ